MVLRLLAFLCLTFTFAGGDPYIALRLHQEQTACFQNDVAANVLTRISYQLEAVTSKGKKVDVVDLLELKVEVYDPLNNIVLSRDYKHAGKIHYTSDQAGVYSVCISPVTKFKHRKTQMKVYFDLQNVGSANYTEVGLNEKYTSIQLEVRKALDSLDLITRWHGYMVKREQRFRQTTNAINWKIFIFGILQIVLLLLLGCWQIRSLKNYFIAKKLV